MLSKFIRLYSNLSYAKLSIQLSKNLKEKPKDFSKIPFGGVFTNHMIEIDWTEADGWKNPDIKPYQSIILDPSSSVFSYCTECYEGFKVYNNPPHLLTFRPEMNLQRFNSSSQAAGLPTCSETELLKIIDELLKIDKDWVPNIDGHSLYVRPFMIGTHPQLYPVKPKSAKLLVILSPVGSYFPLGFKPISLYCDQTLIRAWPGGHGNKKLGGNYGPTIPHVDSVQAKGYDQILWLSEGKVTESGVMNFFVIWENDQGLELITSPVNHTTLPGVTRDSIIQIAKDWGIFKVSERDYTIDQLVDAIQNQKVLEAFGSGTAAVICPINSIHYKDKNYPIPVKLGNSGEFTKKIFDELISIQYGRKKHIWSHYVI
jgi:branched-chain amino acid aminotransferase